MTDFKKIAEEVWADFDALMDVESICTDININNKVEVVKKVSAACTQQLVNLLHELRYNTDGRSLKKTIEHTHEYWKLLYQELLKL